ncbi:hypothetical protein GCM10022226_60540 [Sphaerisporangium flaviroseum]|uniref:DUF3000 domain-containing protein n=1 Tax=Sphaerisporangium flaviroseum TaxID=509199 RepID=A0ABP7J093_9ACTN
MTRWVAVTANVAAPGPSEVAALLTPLLDALGEPVAELREPDSYGWKIPGTWMATAELALQTDDDSREVVARLAARLPVSGWEFSGDEDVADGVWATEDDTATPFPGITWVLVQASHPPRPGEEPRTEDLVLDPPAGELGPEILEYLRSGDEPTRRMPPPGTGREP